MDGSIPNVPLPDLPLAEACDLMSALQFVIATYLVYLSLTFAPRGVTIEHGNSNHRRRWQKQSASDTQQWQSTDSDVLWHYREENAAWETFAAIVKKTRIVPPAFAEYVKRRYAAPVSATCTVGISQYCRTRGTSFITTDNTIRV